jgi:chromosome segregation ATPase
LAELIYKGGAGGVNRASASIVFDNRNKAPGKCPIGFEKFEEIVVSRTVEATGLCKVKKI